MRDNKTTKIDQNVAMQFSFKRGTKLYPVPCGAGRFKVMMERETKKNKPRLTEKTFTQDEAFDHIRKTYRDLYNLINKKTNSNR